METACFVKCISYRNKKTGRRRCLYEVMTVSQNIPVRFMCNVEGIFSSAEGMHSRNALVLTCGDASC